MISLKKTLLLLFIIILFPVYSFCANEEDNKGNIYMIVINRLSLEDIDNMEILKSMIRSGSLGLMNPKGAKSYFDEEGFITINSTDKVRSNFNSSLEKVEEKTNTLGQEVKKEISISNIDEIKKVNKNSLYNSHIGIIGDLLNDNNIKTAVFGNSNTADNFISWNTYIAMDSNGIVDYGNITNITKSDSKYPFNIRTDYKKIKREINNLNNNANFIVIDTGDLERYYRYNSKYKYSRYIDKKLVLEGIDKFLKDMIDTINPSKDIVMIISPNSPRYSKNLSPIILWGKNIEKGLMYSDTTKRKGIITNLDIAPTIIKNFNISYDKFIGKNITSIPFKDNFKYIKKINKQISTTSKLRHPILKNLSIFSFIFICFIIFKNLLNINNNYIDNIIKIIIFTLLYLIILLIIFSLFNNILWIGIIITGILLIITIKMDLNIEIIYTLIYIIIMIDIFLGGNLISQSVLGYDPIIGARYYGIGNEISGILIISMGILSLSIIKHLNEWYTIVIYLLTFLILLFPNLGSNLGGSISIFAMIIYLTFKKLHKTINYKHIIILIIISLLSIIFFMKLIINFNSHIGIFFKNFHLQGISVVMDIIIRKILVNIKLIKNSIWMKILIITTIYIIIFFRFLSPNKYINKKQIFIVNSILIGNIVGLIVNDSGVLLSSLSNLYLCIYLIYVTIINGKIRRK